MKTTALIENGTNIALDLQERSNLSTETKSSAAEIVAKMSNNLSLKYSQLEMEGITNLSDDTMEQSELFEPLNSPKLLQTPKLSPFTKRQYVSFSPLQEWEGYVIDIQEDCFTARLIDLTAGSDIAEEEADFPIEDLSSSDLRLLKLGAVFRWMIGYQRSKGGTKQRVSRVIFRDLPQWTRSELESSRKKASNYSAKIAWN